MRATSRLVWGTFAVLLAYMGVLTVNGIQEPQEIFPFFHWDLFSRVPPAERDAYSIRLVEVDGELLDEPVYFDEADGYVAQPWSPDAYAVMQQLGTATEAGQPLRADNARRTLETRFLNDLGSARYELVKRRVDLLERVDCDCAESETVLAEYSIS